MKLVGYCDMKKVTGKVLFCVDDTKSDKWVGQRVSTEYVYGDVSETVKEDMVGKEIVISYTKGYNGKAQVASVVCK